MPTYTGPPKIMTAKDLLAPAGKEPYTSPRADASNRASLSNVTEFQLHKIEKRDTLLGLSLKYGVAVSELKLANDIPFTSDNLHSCGPTLRIPMGGKSAFGAGASPPSENKEESERAVLRRFRVTHGLEEAEAKYYLSIGDGDFEKATKELQHDLSVESKLGLSTIGGGGGGGGGATALSSSVTGRRTGNVVSTSGLERSNDVPAKSLTASLWYALAGSGSGGERRGQDGVAGGGRGQGGDAQRDTSFDGGSAEESGRLLGEEQPVTRSDSNVETGALRRRRKDD
jgi:hypothetical protein